MDPDSNPFAASEAVPRAVPTTGAASSEPLFSLAQIGTMTVLATPLGASVLIGLNERRLGRKMSTQVGFGVAATVALVGIASLLPDNFPPLIVQIAALMGVRAWATQVQGTDLALHWQANGAQGSWAAVILSGLAVSIAAGGAFVALVLTLDPGLEGF